MWPSRLAVETRLNRKGKETSVIQGRKWKKKNDPFAKIRVIGWGHFLCLLFKKGQLKSVNFQLCFPLKQKIYTGSWF